MAGRAVTARPSWTLKDLLRFITGRGGAIVAIGAVIVAGGVTGGILRPDIPVIGGGGGGGTTGNLWLATSAANNCTGGRSSTPIDYATAVSTDRVCTSMSAAYVAASTGDTVLIRPGSYGNQAITAGVAKSASVECDSQAPGTDMTTGKYPVRVTDYSGCIYFRPETPSTVTFGNLEFDSPYIYLDGGTTPTITAGEVDFGTDDTTCATAHDIVVSGISTRNAFFMKGSHNTLQYSDYNYGDAYNTNTVSQFNSNCPPTANTIYRNTFRNLLQWQIPNQEGSSGTNEMHIECIHHRIGTNTVFDSNKFFNCAEYSISAQSDGGPNVNLKIVNNVFDQPCSHQSSGVIITGTFTSGSNVITSVSSTSNVSVGQGVYSINLPYTQNYLNPPTVPTIASKTSNSITLTGGNATTSRSGATFSVNGGCANNATLQLTGGATFSNPLVAFNTLYNDVDSYDPIGAGITGALSYGNVRMGRGSFFCVNATYSYNAQDNTWPASDPSPFNCGTGGAIGAAALVDVANYDFRIGGSSVANNLVPNNISAGVPSKDVNGNTRTGTNYDAGAYDSSASAP